VNDIESDLKTLTRTSRYQGNSDARGLTVGFDEFQGTPYDLPRPLIIVLLSSSLNIRW